MIAHPQSESVWRAQTAAGMLFNPLGRQRRITHPTLIVQGTADQRTCRTEPLRLASGPTQDTSSRHDPIGQSWRNVT